MKRIIIMAMCLTVAFNATAESDATGWQIGVAAVTGEFERDDKLVDDTSIGFKFFAQYRTNSWLGIEGGFYTSNDFSSDPATVSGTTIELAYQGFMLHGIGYIPLPMEDIDVFVKAGFYDFDVDLAVDGVSTGTGSDDGLAIGTGAAITVLDQLKLRAEFDWFDTESADLWTVSLGLAYHF